MLTRYLFAVANFLVDIFAEQRPDLWTSVVAAVVSRSLSLRRFSSFIRFCTVVLVYTYRTSRVFVIIWYFHLCIGALCSRSTPATWRQC